MWYFVRDSAPPFHKGKTPTSRDGDPEGATLEISTRATNEAGRALSAMNLTVGSNGRNIQLESAYQSAKDFGLGPDPRLKALNGFDAKRHSKIRAAEAARNGRRLAGFSLDDWYWPSGSGTAFYDFLWLQGALNRYEEHLEEILRRYGAFSDCFFRPGPARACQAAAAATASVLLTEIRRNGDETLTTARDSPQGWAQWRNVAIRRTGDHHR